MTKAYPRRARKGEHNYPPLDRYSFVHAVVGAGFGVADAPVWMPLLSTIAWEAIEPALKAARPDIFPRSTRDTGANKLGDMASMMAGYMLTKRKKKTEP